MDTETDPYTCCDMRFTSDLKIHRLQDNVWKSYYMQMKVNRKLG